MTTLSRRFLVVMALLFWQGGFLFYASVVVPVAQELHGHLQQGFVTREVTNYLNLAGLGALLLFAWDLAAERDPCVSRRRARLALWLVLAATLAWLAWLHVRLDGLLDVAEQTIVDRRLFRTGHRLYLWVSTAQLAFGLVLLALTLMAWRAVDRREGWQNETSPCSEEQGLEASKDLR
jgi:hypothetical protein